MEVVLGFAVGYWVGTRHGRDGLQQALDSVRAIMASPETKRALREGLSAVEGLARSKENRGGSRIAMLRDLVDDIIERREAA